MKSLALVLMVLLFSSYVVSTREPVGQKEAVHYVPQAQAGGKAS